MQRIEGLAAGAGTANGDGFPGTVELKVVNPDLTVHQKLVADAIDVRRVGNQPQRRQHAGRHVGVAPGAVGRVDHVDETVVGIHHQIGVHVRRFGGQVRGVGSVARQVRGGFIAGRGQHQRRVDDVAEQYAAYLQPGLVGALAPLHQIVAADAAGQALAERGLLGRRKVAVGQGHSGVAGGVPRLIGRCGRARNDSGVGGPQGRRGIHRASRGEAEGLDRAAPVLGVIAGLEVTGATGQRGAAGDTTASGARLGRDVAQRRGQRGIEAGTVGRLIITALPVTGRIREHVVVGSETHGVGVHVLLGKIRRAPALAREIGACRTHVDVEGKLGDVIQIQRVALVIAIEVVAVIVDAVPVRQATAAQRVVAREGAVVGWQTVSDYHAVVFLTAVLDRAGVGRWRAVVVRRHAAHVAGDFVIGFCQRRVGHGAQAIDR